MLRGPAKLTVCIELRPIKISLFLAFIIFVFGHAELKGQAVEMYFIYVPGIITSLSISLPNMYVVLKILEGVTSKYYTCCPVSWVREPYQFWANSELKLGGCSDALGQEYVSSLSSNFLTHAGSSIREMLLAFFLLPHSFTLLRE